MDTGHWRQGGLRSEPVLERSAKHSGYKELMYSRLHTLLSVATCAGAIAQQAGLPVLAAKPGLMVTDNTVVRRWVAAGELRSWTAHNTTVVHIKGSDMTSAAHQDMWVDVMMLAKADCLVLSGSGFSNAALWMSNTTCYAYTLGCQQEGEQLYGDM
jgi:hypothetical protein